MAKRPATFDHLKSQKKPLQRTITIYLDDDPVVALAEAREALETGKPKTEAELAELQAAVDTAVEAVEQASVQMTFRSIGRKRYDMLVRAFPATDEVKAEHGEDAPYDADPFSVALIAASCIEPVLSEDQVKELRDTWNSTEYVELFATALEVNTQRRVADLGKAYG